MAKIEFKGIEAYAAQLAALGARAAGVCRYAIYDAAGFVAGEIKKAAPEDTGDLRDSVALTHMQDQDGFIYTRVVFQGYDRKGVPNALKARAIEKGTSRMPARPFVRPTVNRVRKQAESAISFALDEKIYSIMNEK